MPEFFSLRSAFYSSNFENVRPVYPQAFIYPISKLTFFIMLLIKLYVNVDSLKWMCIMYPIFMYSILTWISSAFPCCSHGVFTTSFLYSIPLFKCNLYEWKSVFLFLKIDPFSLKTSNGSKVSIVSKKLDQQLGIPSM